MARGGKRKGAGRKLSYDSYKKQYDAAAAKLAKYGLTPTQRKLSETEFKAQYMRMKNQRESDMAIGNRKQIGNITRDLVDKQMYSLTSKQVKAIEKEAKKRLGLSQVELRRGLWLEVSYEKEAERLLNMDPELELNEAYRDAANFISTEFFGS